MPHVISGDTAFFIGALVAFVGYLLHGVLKR